MSWQPPLRTLRTTAQAHRTMIGFPPLPSPEIIVISFALFTAFAISPVGRDVDSFFHLRPVTSDDGALYSALADGFDHISSQKVVVVVMLLVGLAFSWLHRTIAPLLIVALAELAFWSTGVIKILVGKNATRLGGPTYWEDGLLLHGKHSMAYPSGHAMESVALWGVVLLLFVMYTPGWRRRHTIIGTQVWNVIIVQTAVVSWLLGYHWVTDLGGGILYGLLCLTLIYGLAYRGYPQAAAEIIERNVSAMRVPERRPARPLAPGVSLLR